ncbi:MAG: GHKL domain-containing protein [Clostridia bacterium]
MQIFQTIWTTMTTQNEIALSIIFFLLSFIEASVSMLLFTTIFDMKSSRKSKIIYVFLVAIVGSIIRIFIPDPFGSFINILFILCSIKFVFKTSWLKALLSEFIMIALSTVLELFMFKFYQTVLNIPYDNVMTIPIYRFIFTSSIYLCIYLLYRIIKYFKFNIKLENMTKKNKILFIVNTFLGILAIATQIYLMAFYSDKMPIYITITSILSLLAYFIISFYSLLSTNKLDTTTRDLEEAQLYNKTLTILHDSIRGFKHDFHNIVQSIGGYADRGDLEGLRIYYRQLLQDCGRTNNLTALNPEVINNPAIYNVLATKYHKADEIGVQINLGIFINLNEIEKHMKIYEFTRILGILLDNAIEAAAECENKIIHVSFRKEQNRRRLLVIIDNTYKNKDINVDKIYEKDFSTKSKETNSGLGLWEVRQILKKNNNLNLFTTKSEEFFSQQFEIYY